MTEIPTICVYAHRKHPKLGEVFQAIAEKTHGSFELVYVEEPGSSPVNANRALDRASGRYVAFCDYDSIIVSDDWLGVLIDHLRATPETAFVSGVRLEDDQHVQSWLDGVDRTNPNAVGFFLNIPQSLFVIDRERLPSWRFDESCPGDLAGTDLDICVQVWDVGHRVEIIGDVGYRHIGSGGWIDGEEIGKARSDLITSQWDWCYQKWGSRFQDLLEVVQDLGGQGHPWSLTPRTGT